MKTDIHAIFNSKTTNYLTQFDQRFPRFSRMQIHERRLAVSKSIERNYIEYVTEKCREERRHWWMRSYITFYGQCRLNFDEFFKMCHRFEKKVAVRLRIIYICVYNIFLLFWKINKYFAIFIFTFYFDRRIYTNKYCCFVIFVWKLDLYSKTVDFPLVQ